MPALAPLLPLDQLNPARFDAPAILKRLASGGRALAELKGIAASIPNQGILINTLGLQEAKDSSEIENILTAHDELFKDDVLPEAFCQPGRQGGAALPPGPARGLRAGARQRLAHRPTSSRFRANWSATTPAFESFQALR